MARPTDGDYFRSRLAEGGDPRDVRDVPRWDLTQAGIEALAHIEAMLDRLGERLEVVEDKLEGRDPGDE